MKPYYHLVNKENKQAEDNDTEELQTDSTNTEELSCHRESVSVHCLLPGGNDAFVISPHSDTKLNRENKVDKKEY